MVAKLFTDRIGQPAPRVRETLGDTVQTAMLQLVKQRIDDCSFGKEFPDQCPDGTANCGVNTEQLKARMDGCRVIWPKDALILEDGSPSDPQVFDLLEFTYEHIAQPSSRCFHSYFQHDHFDYDQDAGRAKFTNDVNRLFERNGIAYEMHDGQVERLVPPVMQELLLQPNFNTKDQTLNKLLQEACEKFVNRDFEIRCEAVKVLWDAWERLKSILYPDDKKRSTQLLIDGASTEPNFKEVINTEAIQLTKIGNNFMIRHTEVNKTPITEPTHIDYLFFRMFSIIHMLLQSNGITL